MNELIVGSFVKDNALGGITGKVVSVAGRTVVVQYENCTVKYSGFIYGLEVAHG